MPLTSPHPHFSPHILSPSLTSPTLLSSSPTSPSASSPPLPLTITLLGDGGTGKSSLTLRLVRSAWTSHYDPTIEDSYTLTRRIDGQTYHLSLTDTAGQEEYRGMWASANLKSDAFILVYDITSVRSLGVLEEFNGIVEMEAESRREAWLAARGARSARSRARSRSKPKPYTNPNAGVDEEPYSFVPPVKIVAGNKCDLQHARQVSARMGLEWARKRGCGFMETSARERVNVEETLAWVVRRVTEQRRKWGEDQRLDGDGDADEETGSGEERDRENAGLGLDLSGGGLGRGNGLRVDIGHEMGGDGLADRRAVTAPLTPLPVGAEKVDLGGYDDIRRRAERESWWKRWARKGLCWR